MPRKEWKPRNRYCRHSRLDERTFRELVRLWFAGLSARKAATALGAIEGISKPDPKVIARYMQRFGFVLSEMTIERDWAFDYPSFRVLKVRNIQAYIDNIETLAHMHIDDALSNFEYQIYRELNGATAFLHSSEKLAYEIRHICTLRRGISPPYRGDLALAKFRSDTRETLASGASDEHFLSTMLDDFMVELERRPMNISLNSWR